MKRFRSFIAAVLAVFLFTGAAAGEGAAQDAALDWFESRGLTLGQSSVAYPALKEDAPVEGAVRDKINERILEDGHVTDYVTRVSQLISGGALTVSWQAELLGPVFSFELLAEGAVETPRPTSVWQAGSIDLRDGSEIAWTDLFTDPEGAEEAIEAYLEEEVAPEMSAHLQSSDLTPVPALFRVSARGLILLYPVDQLSTLGDRAGAVLIPWDRVAPYLNQDFGSPAEAMGLRAWLPLDENAPEMSPEAWKAAVGEAVSSGEIPGIPAKLGDSVQALTEEWHMLTDPDVYALGRFFALEGAAFRNVFVMTDYLSESWEDSLVSGIRADMGSLYGLTVGVTTQETWRRMLGDPDHTVEMNEEQAEAYRTVPGIRDYYVFGAHRLALHADGEGILRSLILSE